MPFFGAHLSAAGGPHRALELAGAIGLEGFCNVVNDKRLAKLPMVLETPKENGPNGIHWGSA